MEVGDLARAVYPKACVLTHRSPEQSKCSVNAGNDQGDTGEAGETDIYRTPMIPQLLC